MHAASSGVALVPHPSAGVRLPRNPFHGIEYSRFEYSTGRLGLNWSNLSLCRTFFANVLFGLNKPKSLTTMNLAV